MPDPSPQTAPVLVERRPPLLWVTINRPDARNAVDRPTADALAAAFEAFEADPDLAVAILSGADGNFCAGADLKAVASGDAARANRIEAVADRPADTGPDDTGPMGPTRMELSKPVIAMVSGYCVAGGLELALWCDLRVADESAVFGVFCRRFGVPLIDGGTLRLPRAIGMSRAMDMILTGRAVDAAEALAFGLANRVVPREALRAETERLARQLAGFPQACLRGDRRSAREQWGLDERSALANEFSRGLRALQAGETVAGATRFSGGSGRGGRFEG
jgi:enoyl-CoA hydratase